MSKVMYDNRSKTMSIRLKRTKSVDSDIQDNVVIDYDKGGNIVNIDIMNISLNEFGRLPIFSIADERLYAMNEIRSRSQTERFSKNGR